MWHQRGAGDMASGATSSTTGCLCSGGGGDLPSSQPSFPGPAISTALPTAQRCPEHVAMLKTSEGLYVISPMWIGCSFLSQYGG